MAAPGKKFSFMRLVNNAIPNFARDDPNDVDLSPSQADKLVDYQLVLPNPRYLTDESFYVAGIVGSSSLSKKVFRALKKHSMISSSTDEPPVNTAAISRNFANQLPSISVHAQRKLVGLLFFWEEECTRWRMLDLEEDEIKKAIDREGPQNIDLELALEAVQIKKRLLPSERK
ncbi:hypothetical protein GJ744_003166 [Endocarpon pusillum]|uniref:Uncharacterized protein n=1 Tax=Endocarpon pusillum TaxID=364733 RepID=A0A8H7E8A7_9EURO|nr:hypothetical protein GJ744_003166 [Endocarpon pusillum]